MKRFSLIISLLMFFALYTSSQNINEINGVYYADSTPYSIQLFD